MSTINVALLQMSSCGTDQAFDIDQIREYRSRKVWGNAFRRPHRYGLLTSSEVVEPFVRVDAGSEAYDRAKR